MSSKEALIFNVNRGMTVADAAREQGVGRSCANKWVKRVEDAGGLSGLEERSRRPEYSPNRTSQEVVDELLKLKRKHEDYGPAKLVELLERLHGGHVLAVSTAGTILARHGKVQKRGPRRPSMGRIEHPAFEVAGAGDTQTADYKGQFPMGNGQLCYPLTICDPYSRYVLDIVALPSTHMAPTQAAFERVFREHGVPRQIVTDNGTPFCSAISLGGLTRLSRWWIELGVMPVRIQPGRPDQNGIHERMHRTLKDWIKAHRRKDLRSQQRGFDAFKNEFNHVRPHQSLGQKTPDSAFKPYRPFPNRTAVDYDSKLQVRKVNANGEIKWNGHAIFTTEVLAGTHVGLCQISERLWRIQFGPVSIGFFDEATLRVTNRAPENDDDE
jgi:putative transposase